MKHKENKSRIFTGILSALMAVTLCATLTVPAWATEGDVTEPAAVETMAVEQQAEATELQDETTEVPEETTEPQPQVDPTVIWEAKEALLALLPEEVQIAEFELLNAPEWDLELCREDVLAALEKNTQAILLEQELNKVYNEICEKIDSHDGLTQEEKTEYLEMLDLDKPASYSSEELFRGLWNWAFADVTTVETEAWMDTVQTQMEKVSKMSVQMDARVLLRECDVKIGAIGAYLNRETEGQNSAAERYSQLVQQSRQLQEEVKNCLNLAENELQDLTEEIDILVQDVENFAIGAAVDNAKELGALQLEMEKKMVLVYVAMGIGAAGVLIAVIAVVLVVLKSSQKPELDVSALASREAAEVLDAQNRNLKREVAQLNEKLDVQLRTQNEAIKRMEREMASRNAETPKVTKAEPVVAAVSAEPVVETARKIGYLQLEYNALAPGNAYLQKCDQSSEYVLYSDNTVEYVNTKPGTMYHTLSGWINNGLLYLYDPMLDSKVVPADKSTQYSGYYQPKETHGRAKLRQIAGGNYLLVEKGTVSMEKA